jgi:predicted acyltransferase
MAYSLDKQRQQGVSWGASFKKALKRSWWLLFWGVLDYAVTPTGLFILLWDVLTQLSFTTLVAFLIYRWSFLSRAAVCVGLLVLTEVLYRYTHVPGFDQPFTDQHNFGNYVDMLLMHTINKGGWVAINCIPTAVHTIVGTMAGQVLLGNGVGTRAGTVTAVNKVRTLVIWGAASLLLGFGLDWAGITPIIKRISTSSFTLASMGWALWVLALSYWWIDVRDHQKGLKFFTIVGMNSIFIYLFFEIVGSRWLNEYTDRLVGGLLMMVHVPEMLALIIASVAVFALEWGLCYFLYKKKIFFRL